MGIVVIVILYLFSIMLYNHSVALVNLNNSQQLQDTQKLPHQNVVYTETKASVEDPITGIEL